MNPTLRKGILQVHRWTGLTLGLVIVMLAVTAAMIVFRPQLEPVVSSTLFATTRCAMPAPLDALAAKAVAAHSAGRLDDIRIHGAGEPVQFRFLDRQIVYVDPCSGQVLGEQNKYGGWFGLPERLHRFKFIDGEAGTIADGTITLVFALSLIAGGVVLWWPATRAAFKSGLKFRPHLKGVAFELNLHNVVGIYTAVVLLVTTLTALPISFAWLRNGIGLTQVPTKEAKPFSTPQPGAQRLPMETLWQRARAMVEEPREAVLRYPRKPTDAVAIWLVGRHAPHSNARSYVFVDAYSGSILSFTPYEAASLGFRIWSWVVPLHTGEVGGPVVQFLFLLGMLGVPVLAYTGFSSYLRRRFGPAKQAKPLEVRVARIRDETADIKSFRLTSARGRRLPRFTPGAHISVCMPGGLTRQYSLCNGPADAHDYHIAVKRESDSRGGSRTMHEDIREGDVLTVLPPRNHFPLAQSARYHVLIAGGIGITPLLSMARHLGAAGAFFELHYFVRSERSAAFAAELADPRLAGNVHLHHALDRAAKHECLQSLLRVRAPGAHLYVCGPKPFMDHVASIAADAWPEGTVHQELFGAGPGVSDQPRVAFQVELARTRASYAIPADKSILQVLADHGVYVANSCAEGVCGTCVTGVIDGEPDHRDAFLSQRERKRCDKMLLCVSRAKGERLVLDL